MIRYPFAYNPIMEYWNQIESGEEVVSNKVKRVYKKLVDDFDNGNSEWEY
ncbi:terminase, partial [Bacillus toyonensis]